MLFLTCTCSVPTEINIESSTPVVVNIPYIDVLATVQLRCNFTLAREQFTRTLEQFTRARVELHVASVLLPARNSCKIIR